MSVFDKNLLNTRVIKGSDTLSALNDFQVILDSSTLSGAFNLTLPPGKNDLSFRVGASQASITASAAWTLVPNGSDTVDAAVGVLGAGSCGIVYRNGIWYKI